MKIDAIIPWVDGNDPVLNAKRHEYGDAGMFMQENVASSTRYANVGELFWCVASINRFAPWINRIYVVTDNQDPDLTSFLERHFPDGYIPVEIIDHKVIFQGYEEYLPTFNSLSIEAMMWRIPGLSERFICFNDDFVITAPVAPEDFYTPEGWPVCVAEWYPTLWGRMLLALKPRKNGMKQWSFKGMMLNASEILGDRLFFPRVNHTPRGMLKSYFEDFFEKHPELLIRNIKYKFRDTDQFYVISLQYMDLYRQGKCRVVPVRDYLFYMKSKAKPNYVKRKMDKLKKRSYKFCCFNSLDQASDEDRKMVVSWIENVLGL